MFGSKEEEGQGAGGEEEGCGDDDGEKKGWDSGNEEY